MKTKMKSSHMNNKGFSLLELIVVMAIMVVLVAVGIASSSILNSSYVKEVEQGIEDYVSMARSKSMSVSAKEWFVVLTTENEEYMAKLCKTTEEVVGEVTQTKTVDVDKDEYNKKVTVVFNDGVNKWDIDKDSPLCIYFDSATGKVKKVTVAGADVDISNGIGRVEIASGNYDITMKIFYNTGKCERE